MFKPVDHVEYCFIRGRGWVPHIVRQGEPDRLARQAAKAFNFGAPGCWILDNASLLDRIRLFR